MKVDCMVLLCINTFIVENNSHNFQSNFENCNFHWYRNSNFTKENYSITIYRHIYFHRTSKATEIAGDMIFFSLPRYMDLHHIPLVYLLCSVISDAEKWKYWYTETETRTRKPNTKEKRLLKSGPQRSARWRSSMVMELEKWSPDGKLENGSFEYSQQGHRMHW